MRKSVYFLSCFDDKQIDIYHEADSHSIYN